MMLDFTSYLLHYTTNRLLQRLFPPVSSGCTMMLDLYCILLHIIQQADFIIAFILLLKLKEKSPLQQSEIRPPAEQSSDYLEVETELAIGRPGTC
jgi:hypothetical protein